MSTDRGVAVERVLGRLEVSIRVTAESMALSLYVAAESHFAHGTLDLLAARLLG